MNSYAKGIAKLFRDIDSILIEKGDMQTNKVVQLYNWEPNAFFVALIIDQGVRAEKIWSIPPFGMEFDYSNLNKYSYQEIQHETNRVGYRFPNRAARHIYISIWLLYDKYGGKAINIWDNKLFTAEIEERLQEFPGIGPKKSALCVNMLNRDLHVLDDTHKPYIDIAYDIHLRRVFLRSGLAEEDDIDHMKGVAKSLCWDYPAVMDLPSWYIGREYCHNTNPKCSECPIGLLCEKKLEVTI